MVSQSLCCILSQEFTQEVHTIKPALCSKGLENSREIAKNSKNYFF